MMQKARAGQSVSDETVATYTAAKGFLISENFGALLMVYSFTHLYVFGLRPGGSTRMALTVAIVCLVLGSLMYWRSRVVYLKLDFPWQRKWEIIASLLAAAAGIFWLLFVIAAVLAAQGVSLLG
jgi:hypothetical protein